jgi:pyridinium-3,5-biscarboxylic acid mononucleotide sulfurtransferase
MSESKLLELQNILRNMQSVLVAYSGGMDSSFLLKVAKDVLNENVLAVTADSEIYSPVETESAVKFAAEIGVNHLVVKTNELKNKEFVKNSTDRCFHCKLSLYGEFIKLAGVHHLNQVIDGINSDDKKDFRPGMSAAVKLKIRSPLLEAGLTKEDIRMLSKKMNLSTWDKVSNPCLSTRFPYGTELTRANLSKVEQAEMQLRKYHFKQFRLRIHDNIARLELLPEDMIIAFNEENRKEIINTLKGFGYTYITIDLEGYRTGSMNEKFRVKNISSDNFQ